MPRDPNSRLTFVGRARELGLLSAGADAAREGRGGLFLISGEPGIGKTRLADELSEHAAAADMLVCCGRCWEAGGPPSFWPWIQVFRALVRALDADAGSSAAFFTELVPGPGSPSARKVGFASEHARFTLFDAVTTFLADVARARAMLIVLDDLHAADPASLLLLQFVARALRETRILLVGTHREAEVMADPERARLLLDVAREATEMPLCGLDPDDSAALVEAVGGARPSPVLATSLHELTGGNPFFLDELTRLMVAGDPQGWTVQQPPFALPDRVRVAVRRRLDTLPKAILPMLEIASVIGVQFDVRLLGRVLGLGTDEVVAQLEVSAAARLVRAVPDRPERRRFAHALIREVLYDELAPVRRAALHRGVGEALEALLAGRLDAILPALADHFLLAEEAARALGYVERAGRQALAHMAYEDAVRYLAQGLRLLEVTGARDDRLRVELLQALGDAQRRAGDVQAGHSTLREAALVARELRDAELLARVALAFGWSFELGRAGHERVTLLEEALRLLGETPSVLRARVLGTLAVALYWEPAARDRMLRLSEEAVDLARRFGDASALGHVLHCRRWVLGPGLDAAESLTITGEILALADQAGDRELVLQCRRWRVADLVSRGEIDAAWSEVQAHDTLARELRLPLYQWYSAAWRTMRALLEGRFEDAEREAGEAYRLGARAEPNNAEATYLGHIHYLRVEQGRVYDLLPAARVLAREGTPAPGFRAGLAGLLAEAGIEDEARRLLDEFAAAGFPVPPDKSAPYVLASLADACALVGDAIHAATLYPDLQPYAGGVIATEPCFLVGGAADRSLAVLAATMERWSDAERHFQEALRLNTALRARPWVARTQQEYATMLTRRAQPGDRERARALADAALATARELGMATIVTRAERVLTRLGPGETGSPTSAYLRMEGDYWTIGYRERAVRLRATVGLRYLARLLRSPGAEFYALELASDAGGRGGAPERGDAGPMLDAAARAAYRTRLADIDRELGEAEAANDLGRRERLSAERDMLGRELSAALGLGGRERRAGSAVERARLNVSRAIKTALARIRDVHPDLGQHLGSTVRTGTYCSYQPDPRVPIDWTD